MLALALIYRGFPCWNVIARHTLKHQVPNSKRNLILLFDCCELQLTPLITRVTMSAELLVGVRSNPPSSVTYHGLGTPPARALE